MKKFDYEFKDKALFDLAMTQSGADRKNNNERLEFVGDRVLGLAVAEMLYKMFPAEKEGELAKRQAKLVSAATLDKIAKSFGFERLLRHGHLTGGKSRNTNADAMESVIAAIFLDSDWATARDFVIANWRGLAESELTAPKDPKTKLQEHCQREAGVLPVYEISAEQKDGNFTAIVSAMGKTAEGQGASKKEATAFAAAAMLKVLGI